MFEVEMGLEKHRLELMLTAGDPPRREQRHHPSSDPNKTQKPKYPIGPVTSLAIFLSLTQHNDPTRENEVYFNAISLKDSRITHHPFCSITWQNQANFSRS